MGLRIKSSDLKMEGNYFEVVAMGVNNDLIFHKEFAELINAEEAFLGLIKHFRKDFLLMIINGKKTIRSEYGDLQNS